MRRRVLWPASLFAAFCLLCRTLPCAAAELDAGRFKADLKELTATAHRLSGTAEAMGAGKYIESELNKLSGKLLIQRFSLPQSVADRCELRTLAGALRLLPLQPNGVQACVTPRDGYESDLIYVGSLRFSVSDVLDWGRFIGKLKAEGVAQQPCASRQLWRLFDADLQKTIFASSPAEGVGDSLKAEVATAVNDVVLTSADLYDRDAWAQVAVRPETAQLVRTRKFGMTTGEACRLNRLLLEDAYPELISRAADGKDLTGRIVVTDWSSMVPMTDLFRLNARAVIFVRGDRDSLTAPTPSLPIPGQALRTWVSADLPRFYVAENDARPFGLLTGVRATLVSDVQWRKLQGRNIFLWIEGTKPVFPVSKEKEEFIILSAHYDSAGLVPCNSPDQESAADCAALLETARYLSANPPRRSVLIAFFDNHANFLQGAREFYIALRKSILEGLKERDSLSVRRQFVQQERAQLAGYFQLFDTPKLWGRARLDLYLLLRESAPAFGFGNPAGRPEYVPVRAKGPGGAATPPPGISATEFALVKRSIASAAIRAFFEARHPLKEDAINMLKDQSKFKYNSLLEEMSRLRLAIEELRKAKVPDTGRIAGLHERLTLTEAQLTGWQRVRESVRDRKPAPAREVLGVASFWENVDGVVRQFRVREAQLDEVDMLLDDSMKLMAPMTGATPVSHVSYGFTAGDRNWLFLPHIPLKHLKIYGDLLDAVTDKLSEEQRRATGFVWESRSTWESASRNPAAYVDPRDPADDCDMADPFEIPALTLVTELDLAARQGKPDATFAPEELDRIRVQANGFLPFLDVLGNSEIASAPNAIVMQQKVAMDEYVWRDGKPDGHMVKTITYGDTVPSKAEPNVLVHVIENGRAKDYYTFTDGNGIFPLCPVLTSLWARVQIEAAKFDDRGFITNITTAIPGGLVAKVQTEWAKAGYYNLKADTGSFSILAMFQGISGKFIGRTLPLGAKFKFVSTLGTAFKFYNGFDSQFQLENFRFDQDRGIGVYWVDRATGFGVKIVYMDPRELDDVALFTRATPEKPIGIGYGPGNGEYTSAEPFTLDMEQALAADMRILNNSRLEKLSSKNIVLNFMEYMNGQATELLGRFEEASKGLRHTEAATHATAAACYQRRVYRPVVGTMNDMLSAVTVLLLLAIPFAFSMQSLVLPSYSIYRKIAGFAFFFALSFITLYFTHPAFGFSQTPVVIILAFIIMVMSGAVIGVIGGKFNYEIKKLQGLATASHTFQRRLFGNLGAAVSLAISIMQRRPARTALTVITVLLLTFTILSFVAFQSERGINRYYLGPADDQVSRLMVHRKIWKPMDADLQKWQDHLRTYYGTSFEMHGRYWLARELAVGMVKEDLYIPILARSGKTAAAGAIMTLDKLEIDRLPAIRAALSGDIEQFDAGKGVFLSSNTAKALDVKQGDTIRIRGRDVLFLGTFDSRRVLDLRQVDGSTLVPINYSVSRLALGSLKTTGSAQGGQDTLADLEDELGRLEPGALQPVSPEALVIAPTAYALPFKMTLESVTIYPKEGAGADIEKLAQEAAIFNFDGAYLNVGGERAFLFYGDKIGVAGAGDVVIPLILGALIIFSTMLGSIIDRQKEIYTFSALGLAPRNIAMLFFVEAAIYAVIGGFGGYLFSQVVTRVLEFLASRGIFRAPEMNYSSTTVIYTILIVMATVMVSTIYPAIKAANKATADTMRFWRVPSPKGDVCEFDFPFTISRFDITGIICFIREHFANHADRTVGRFAADDVQIRRDAKFGMASLRADIWLQPFDQGISQRFELVARPSDIEEVCDIHIRIERLSGPPSAWKRSYVVYFDDLRSQFLLWRTLSDEAREHYLALADSVEEDLAQAAAGEERASVT